MRNGAWVVALVMCGVGGCDGDKGGASPDMLFLDENNFALDPATSDMTLYQGEVVENAHFCFDWSALTTDIRGRPLDPGSIEQALLVEFPYDEEGLIVSVVDENYVPADGVEPYVLENPPGGTSGCTDDMEVLGNPLTPDAITSTVDRTWMLSLVTFPRGSTEEVQQVMRIIPGPTGHTGPDDPVPFTDGLSSITLDPVLSDIPILTVPEANRYTLDWGGLTTDVSGRPWENLLGDRLFILRYDGTVEDIEADFLLLDYHAEELYELDVYGVTSADLSEAVDADGAAFPGFTTQETWLIGIACSTCISPVPYALAVVQVEAE